jgi:LIM and senescent cell antigen-like-containing domain protein 1/2
MINLSPANATPGVSSGPGAMSSGPGVTSYGPGGAAVASFGPGGAAMFGPGANNLAAAPAEDQIKMATHTPDGREIIHKGPPCANCGEMIIGQCLNALGKTYHPEHFVCACCSQPFQGGKFMIKDDEPYCETDYFELFGNRCRTCKEIIRAQYVSAGPYFFHPEHFVCFTCGKKLIGTKYKTQENSDDMPVLCVDCHVKRVVTIDPNEKMCARCKKPIVGQWITLKGQTMHPEHFRCEECGCAFTGGNCHEYEGALYCTEHYEALLKKSCSKCGKPVLGRGVTACGRVFHPEHFGCHVCGDMLSSSSFYEKDNEPYCQVHYIALFGVLCGGCGKPVSLHDVSFLFPDLFRPCLP